MLINIKCIFIYNKIYYKKATEKAQPKAKKAKKSGFKPRR